MRANSTLSQVRPLGRRWVVASRKSLAPAAARGEDRHGEAKEDATHRRPVAVDAVWALLFATAVVIVITYSRLPPEELYNVSEDGLAEGLGRALVFLNYPVSLVAIAIAWLAAERIGSSYARLAALVASGLCAVTHDRRPEEGHLKGLRIPNTRADAIDRPEPPVSRADYPRRGLGGGSSARLRNTDAHDQRSQRTTWSRGFRRCMNTLAPREGASLVPSAG
jgi:hypothetical protein